MASFTKIAIVGYLGRDPELRYTPQGTPVCNFSVATTEKRKNSAGELHEITTWFQVAFFGRQAEVIKEYLSKGSQVWLEGSLNLNQWTDKADRAGCQVLESKRPCHRSIRRAARSEDRPTWFIQSSSPMPSLRNSTIELGAKTSRRQSSTGSSRVLACSLADHSIESMSP